jgi:hypothetical protein
MRRPAILCLAALLAAGCAPLYRRTDPETGIAFRLCELRAPVEADVARVALATKSAFRALQIRERFADVSGLDAELTGRTARGHSVRVVVAADGLARSTVRIRIGRLGDRTQSQALLEAIRGELARTGG